MKFKCDLKVENLNEYFAFQAKLMTLGQRENLPPGIAGKIFRKDGKVTTKNLTFLEQMYILYKAMNKDIYVVIKDEHRGLGVADFETITKKIVNRQYDVEESEKMLSKGVMVLAGKDLAEWAAFMNGLSTSAAYNYALKVKNTHSSKLPGKKKELAYFVNALMAYESNKKKIIVHKNVTIPELYVLYYLYDEKEHGATEAYCEIFKDAFNSSKNQMLRGFKSLQEKGYIQMFGKARAIKYRITSIGKAVVGEIIQKYVIV